MGASDAPEIDLEAMSRAWTVHSPDAAGSDAPAVPPMTLSLSNLETDGIWYREAPDPAELGCEGQPVYLKTTFTSDNTVGGQTSHGLLVHFAEGFPEEITWVASEFDFSDHAEVVSSIEQYYLDQGEASAQVRRVKLLIAGTFGEVPESGRYGLNHSVETPEAIRGRTEDGTATPVP